MDAPNAIPIETYGVELHRDRAEEAEKRLGRALASDLFATSIANGAFGLLLLNPPYDHDSEDKRTEHAFLTQTTRYLAEGGLLVFIVPRQRLAVSARYLSTHYGRMRFLDDPSIEPTNNRAERTLLPAVIARKVSHCSKNAGGADTFSAFTSVIRTLGRNGGDRSAVDRLCDVFSGAPLHSPSL